MSAKSNVAAGEGVVSKVITRHLPCQLSDEERLAYADKLADATNAIEIAKDNMKSMQKQMQTELTEVTARRDKINRIVASKTEYRDIDVEIEKNYETGRVRQVRIDTGEIIVDRPMTQKEKQASLLDGGELDEDLE